MDRLERYREYMDRLDAAANPQHALKSGLYVEPPGRSVAQDLALRFELRPASTHLVVGAVGSGKSTQLLKALMRLNKVDDISARYLDVSQHHDLDQLNDGVLLVLAGLRLSELTQANTDPKVKKARRNVQNWAPVYIEWVRDNGNEGDGWDGPDEPPYGYLLRHEPLLKPPIPSLKPETAEKLEVLRTLMEALPSGTCHVVLLFDSLDRLNDPQRFQDVVEQDVQALSKLGIGLVVVGPSRLLYGVDRPKTEIFDYFYEQPTVEAKNDEAMRDFLNEVLLRRDASQLLTSEGREAVVRWSGGVLRDLVKLACQAGEEAYLDGSDVIVSIHVDRAADAFGRSMMLGLRSEDLRVLQRWRKRGIFVPTKDTDLALLESRRVLAYRGIETRYAVHPTIAPLLESLEDAA